MSEHYDYDAIIIGAGISGLVCGCYLAKAGLKVLIVEKNSKPGGYCMSFTRRGYHFDACVHALSSLRKGGILNRFLTELDIINKIKIIRHDPSDIILLNDIKIKIFNNVPETVNQFKKAFPKEQNNIDNFFKYIITGNFLEVRSKTYQDFLNGFFCDNRLKSIFSIIMMQLLGVVPLNLSSVVACLLWKEFMLDGGYYPERGLQELPNTLLKRFKELKGDVIFSTCVKRIEVENNTAKGVYIGNGKFIRSKYVISACDANQTFLSLIGEKRLKKDFVTNLKRMKPASSGFLLYLGTRKNLIFNDADLKSNIYVITESNMKKVESNFLKSRVDHFVISSPSSKSHMLSCRDRISLFIGTNSLFKGKGFWNHAKRENMANELLSLVETVIPKISKILDLKINASPVTLLNWSSNYQGSGYGWASTVGQFCNPLMSQKTEITNLYITGHWSNQSSGVSFVANCGKDAAEIIIHKEAK